MPLARGHIWILALIAVATAVFGAAIGAVLALTRDLPQIRSLESYRPPAITRIYSAERVLLDEVFVEKREPVPLQQIPPALVKALITTEDRQFFSHSGIDIKGIARAIIHNLMAGRYVEGASTITQQLAKTLFLTPRKTLKRKLREALLAFQIERRYTKPEILTLYLNQIYLGSGVYGVASAARRYFAKPLDRLTLAECALIAGMPKAPSRYSPLVNPELALQRRRLVLQQMRTTGAITQAEYQQADAEPYRPPAGSTAAKAPYFVDYVRAQLEALLPGEQLYKAGLTVVTTLSWPHQQAAEQAVGKGLERLQKRLRIAPDDADPVQGALVALDVASGGILAMVGGRAYHGSPYNRAVNARRQPGSAFKPLVYALAVERGFAQNHMVLDAPLVFKKADGVNDWRPQNFSRTFRGSMTLREALAVSQNIPAVRLIEMLGPAAVVRFAHTLGIRSQLAPNLSLALGSSEVGLLELTSAYATFASAGRHDPPLAILEIQDHNGRQIQLPAPGRSQAISPAGAAVVTDMLQAVIAEGSGRAARGLGRPLAGKTGTSSRYTDALFVGYSPTVAAGVWVGRDQNTPLGKGATGSRAALPVWIAYMDAMHQNEPVRRFALPDDVIRRHFDRRSGRFTDQAASGAVSALFLKPQP